MRFMSILITFVMMPFLVRAQDIEQIGKNPIGLAGSIRLATDFYSVNGIDPRRSPSSWQLSGNASFQLAGISFPFSFSFRDQQLSYGASFNQFGISPYYKWITVHAGWRSMSFSPYTMNGRTFLGGGVELTPGHFRLSGFYGKFKNLLAVQDSIVYGSSTIPIYDRIAYGGKIGFGSEQSYFDLMVIKAWDDTNTPGVNEDQPNPYYYAYEPKENVIVGTSFKIRIIKKVDIYGNIAASGYTENTELESLYEPDIEYLENVYTLNASSRFALAGDAGIKVRVKRNTIGLQYKRVEPFYSTLTTDYFYNDIENITAQFSTSTRKGQFRFSGNMGFEHNNLYDHQSVTSSRVIGAANVTVMPIAPLVISVRYSNYTQNSESGLQVINDTLRLATTSANTGLMANYTLGSTKNKSIAFYAGRTTITDNSPVVRLDDLTTDMISASYSQSFTDLDLRVSPSINYNRYLYPSSRQERIGAGLTLTKAFMEKKLSLSLGSNYSRNDIDTYNNGYVISSRMGVSYTPYKSGTFNLSMQHISNQTILEDAFSEIRGRIQYTQKLGF
jgi:hypothetical protein